MTAALAWSYTTWDDLVHYWQQVDLPNEAWRAEIIEESIVMTPPPDKVHDLISSRVTRTLAQHIPDEWEIFHTQGVSIPHRSCLFIPDVLVIPQDRVCTDDPMPTQAGQALLVAEITSKSNADRDRKTKLWSYAHAGVPLYLLIDRLAEEGPSVFLHSGPQDGSYLKRERIPFGQPAELPDPFNLPLPTDQF